MICENHIWETLPDGTRICFECDEREDSSNRIGELETLGRTIAPGRINASIQIKIFVGDCPTVGEPCTIMDGDAKGEWIIKKVEILDDCLELTLHNYLYPSKNPPERL